MSNTFGWMLSTAVEDDLDSNNKSDSANGLCVCLIRPYLEESSSANVRPEVGPDMTAPTAFAAFGALLFPWQWENCEWVIYEKSGSTWVEIKRAASSSGVTPVDQSVARVIADEVTSEIKKKTGIEPAVNPITPAFSMHPDHAEPAFQKSLVHALAPMSQLTAPLANDVLRFGHIIRTSAPDFKDDEPIERVTFPTFKANGDTYTPLEVMPDENEPDLVRARYESIGDTEIIFVAEIGTFRKTSAAKVTPRNEVSDDTKKQYRERDSAMESIYFELSPAVVATKALPVLGLKEAINSKWGLLLLNSLGVGWLLDEDEDETYINHAFHGLLPESELMAIAGKSLQEALPAQSLDLAAARVYLPKSLVIAATPLAGEETFFATLRTILHIDVADPAYKDYKPENWNDLLADWVEAAALLGQDDRRTSVMTCWLQYIVWRWRDSRQAGNLDVTSCDELTRMLAEYASPHQVNSIMMAALDYGLGGHIRSYIEDEFPISMNGTDATQNTDEGNGGPGRFERFISWLSGSADEQKSDATSIRTWLEGILDALGFVTEVEGSHVDGTFVDKIALKWINKRVTAFVQRVTVESEKRALPRDDGLVVRVEDFGVSGDSADDTMMRGYAIGLRGYLFKGPEDTSQPSGIFGRCWITNSGMKYRSGQQKLVLHHLAKNGDKIPIVAPCAVGSALANGRRIVEVLYDGSPLCAARATLGESGADLVHTGWSEYVADPDAPKDEPTPDYDGTDSFDYAWYGGYEKYPDHLVPLAYGATYDSVITRILNSGVVEDSTMRSGANVAELKPISAIEAGWSNKETFLCNEGIGAPSFAISSNTNMPTAEWYRLSTQTKAASFARTAMSAENQLMAKDGRPADRPLAAVTTNPRVALLVPPITPSDKNPFIATAPTQYTVILEPPIASPVVVERWMNSDYVLAMQNRHDLISNKVIRDHVTGSADGGLKDIKALAHSILDYYTKLEADGAEIEAMPIRFHPAVRGYGLRATWYGGPRGQQVDEKPVWYSSVKAIDNGTTLAPTTREEVRATLSIEATTANDQTRQISVGGQSVAIPLGPGEFLKLEIFSLVETALFEKHGDQTLERLSATVFGANRGEFLFKDPSDPNGEKTIKTIGFGGNPYWFETVPLPVSEVTGLNDSILKLQAPRAPNQPAKLRLDVPETTLPLSADWLLGLKLQRHQWHWVGTPAEFYADEGLANNLVNLAGVGSFRETREVTLLETFDEQTGYWRIVKEQTLATSSRSPVAPADYLVYTAQPIVRFADWLSDEVLPNKDQPKEDRVPNPLAVKGARIAVGALIPGQVPDGRLETPVARWIAPLTESYEYQSDNASRLPTRGTNGVMIVFDESIMRTDERTRYGGIAEMVEVDVVDVRPYEKERTVTKEMGPNPIFHKAPILDNGKIDPKVSEYNVSTSIPFGLTYDIGDNPKVAQSSVTVFPEHADGRWFMAKLRTRRSLCPELLIDYPDPVADAHREYDLPVRKEGDDKVSADAFVDFSAFVKPKKITIMGDGIDDIPLSLPPFEAKPELDEIAKSSAHAAYRYRITWHKNRFGTAGPPHWRPQVELQSRLYRDKKLMNMWKTESIRSPFDGNYDSTTWPAKTQLHTISLSVESEKDSKQSGAGIRLGQLHISDYSDPFWVSFVGMFDTDHLGRADQYHLAQEPAPSTAITIRPEAGRVSLPRLQSVTKSFDEPSGSTVFHLLNVYVPTRPLMHTEASPSSGRLLATYRPKAGGREGEFEPLDGKRHELPSGAFAYLMSFQRINSLQTNAKSDEKSEIDPSSGETWEGLQDIVFPAIDKARGLNQLEALVRPVPQYLGPIPTKNAGPSGNDGKNTKSG